jgi:hypothetical protein
MRLLCSLLYSLLYPLPVGLVKFNWVELFTLRRLMDSMQILPRTLLTKLGKSKPNMLYTALRSRVASRGILAASIVGETPKKENSLFSTKKKTFNIILRLEGVVVSTKMPAFHNG